MNNNAAEIINQWIHVGGIPLDVLKCGSLSGDRAEKELFVIIPGNPGCMGFYNTFAEALYTRSAIPVWGISHTGHAPSSKKGGGKGHAVIEHPPLDECGLLQQIEHKVAFLEQEVIPYFDKVYLVGHSIGCYIILHIMDRMNNPKLHKGIMLFPTIERMAVTPEGKKMTPALMHGRWVFVLFAWVLSNIPGFFKKWLVDYFFKFADESSRETIIYELLFPEVINSATLMGLQEMKMVNDRDDGILGRQADKLVFYYGAKDSWCPVSYYEEMKKTHQDLNLHVCKHGYMHAFVLSESIEVADVVHDLLKSDFSRQK